MSKWPDVINEETLAKNADISDGEIRADIYDAQLDIKRLEQEIKGNYLIAEADPSSPNGKIAYFKATGKEHQVQEVRDFIEFLERLLEARKNGS